MAYSETFDTTTPAGSEVKSLGDDRIRELKRALNERLADVLDNWPNTDPVRIKDGSLTSAAFGLLAVNTAALADLAVTTGKVADGAITEAKLGALAVATAKIADAAVTLAKLAANSVDSTKLTDSAVITAKLVNGAVTAPKIDAALAAAMLKVSGHNANGVVNVVVAATSAAVADVTVAGILDTDILIVQHNASGLAGMGVSAPILVRWGIFAADTVRFYLYNPTGSPISFSHSFNIMGLRKGL